MSRKGYKPTKEHRENLKRALLGHAVSEESKEKNRQSHLGKSWGNHTEESKEKIRQSQIGKKLSEKHKEKIGQSNLGKRRTETYKERRRRASLGKKNPNWRGGKSFELYGFEWTELLKHSIRTRDCFVCQICKKNGWVIHHIDYNKRNNNPTNLITLCPSCHCKTNFNREYWMDYFERKIEKKND